MIAGNTDRSTPSLSAIRCEIVRIEEMLVAVNEQIDSVDPSANASIELQFNRAELREYWAGLTETLERGRLVGGDGLSNECNPDSLTLN